MPASSRAAALQSPLRDPAARSRFRRRLLQWYGRNRRLLPWRGTRDPYRVWVSEIMLQQTRVAAVIERYSAFLARFPRLADLAEAPPCDVLAAWSGLGYYRRARALHAAAGILWRQHGGSFPRSARLLAELPGIGRYTAAAVASIAFDQPVPVVDGNVERVLRRWFALRPPGADPWTLAQSLLSPTRPGDFNQALMELGATLCLPANPRCAQCPVAFGCATRGTGGAPTRRPRRVRRRVRYCLATAGKKVFLVLRPEQSSLLPGMWELPECPRPHPTARPSFVLRHSITVTDYEVHVLRAPAPPPLPGEWVLARRAAGLPLTGLARKILRRARIIQ
jgi:A/G-specific adenine glycosylase